VSPPRFVPGLLSCLTFPPSDMYVILCLLRMSFFFCHPVEKTFMATLRSLFHPDTLTSLFVDPAPSPFPPVASPPPHPASLRLPPHDVGGPFALPYCLYDLLDFFFPPPPQGVVARSVPGWSSFKTFPSHSSPL